LSHARHAGRALGVIDVMHLADVELGMKESVTDVGMVAPFSS
jgi:hypothetical protein